jgi:hypothetical protein
MLYSRWLDTWPRVEDFFRRFLRERKVSNP